MNEQEFFREATIRICGSLDVETFLYQSFMYLKQVIPADTAYLTHHAPEKGQHVLFAEASETRGRLVNLGIPLPKNIKRFAQRLTKETVVIDRAETFPTAQPWIALGKMKKDCALLVLRLIMDESIIGAAILMSEQGGAFSRQHADLFSLLHDPFAIALSNSLRYEKLLELKELLAEDNHFLRQELLHDVGKEIVGADFGLKNVMDMLHQVAPLASPVLLQGETGTGKEVIASAIHTLSRRSQGPFIKVNCGAIPDNLMDSELFGHEKGAFTGAISRKRGRFERAHTGTIFLDEVGELQPDAQVRLLRVLQEKEIERVGGIEAIPVDIRVIAATHRDLHAMIAEGTFREDLFFRLNVFPITIPPLRERIRDIPALLTYFITQKAREIGRRQIPSLAPKVLERLMSYSWPGNVRELQNAVERELILNRGDLLTFEEVRTEAAPEGQHAAAFRHLPSQSDLSEEILALDDVVSRHIRRMLHHSGGRVGGPGGAADLLGINPSTLRKRMRKLGIPFGRGVKEEK